MPDSIGRTVSVAFPAHIAGPASQFASFSSFSLSILGTFKVARTCGSSLATVPCTLASVFAPSCSCRERACQKSSAVGRAYGCGLLSATARCEVVVSVLFRSLAYARVGVARKFSEPRDRSTLHPNAKMIVGCLRNASPALPPGRNSVPHLRAGSLRPEQYLINITLPSCGGWTAYPSL